MSDSEFQAVERRAHELAAAGDWLSVLTVLSAVDPARVLAAPVVAYRYGEALYHTGRMQELARFAGRYEEEARTSADVNGTMRALNLAGIAAFELGDIDTAEVRWDDLLGLADGCRDEDMLARAANNLGAIANLRGKHVQAVAFYRLALTVYQRLGQRRGLAQTYHNLGISLRDLDRFDDATSAFARAIREADAIPYRPVVAMSLISRAELEVRRRDLEVAHELAGRGLVLARELEDPISEGEALRVRGVARAAAGRHDEALADLNAALDLSRATNHVQLEAETLCSLGERPGIDEAESLEWLSQAVTKFDALGASAEAERLRERLAEPPQAPV